MARTKRQENISHDANTTEEDAVLRKVLMWELEKRPQMNQSEFANLLGISSGYLSEILNGKKSGQRYALKFFIRLGIADNLLDDKAKSTLGSGWPDHIRRECETLKLILESDDTVIKDAIKSNIRAFRLSIEKDREREEALRDLEIRIRDEYGKKSIKRAEEYANNAAKARVDEHQEKFSDVGFAFHIDTKEEDGSQK